VAGKWFGVVKSRSRTGTTSEGSYVDGKKHGLWTYYVCDNNRELGVVHGHYLNGVESGRWTIKLASGETYETDL